MQRKENFPMCDLGRYFLFGTDSDLDCVNVHISLITDNLCIVIFCLKGFILASERLLSKNFLRPNLCCRSTSTNLVLTFLEFPVLLCSFAQFFPCGQSYCKTVQIKIFLDGFGVYGMAFFFVQAIWKPTMIHSLWSTFRTSTQQPCYQVCFGRRVWVTKIPLVALSIEKTKFQCTLSNQFCALWIWKLFPLGHAVNVNQARSNFSHSKIHLPFWLLRCTHVCFDQLCMGCSHDEAADVIRWVIKLNFMLFVNKVNF